jgi:uridine kinase
LADASDGSTSDGWLAGRLASELLSRPPRIRSTRLLAIDGPAGSGKTSHAHAAAQRLVAMDLSAAVLDLDELYDGWTGLNPELEQRVLRQVLLPLVQGRRARWQQYDWQRGAFNGWREMQPPDVLVLEGCGAGALCYATYTALLVWLEAPPDVRVARAVRRDGEQVLEHWVAWSTGEERHFAANHTRGRADVLVRT